MQIYVPRYKGIETPPPPLLPRRTERIYAPGSRGYEETLRAMPRGQGSLTGGMQSLTGLETNLLGSSGGGATPPVPGYIQWYDAGQQVYKDAGTTPAVNGDTVQQWNDLSGNSHHLSQATALNRPTYSTNQLNGLPSIVFNGTSSRMRTGSFSNSQPLSYYVVIKVTAVQSGYYWDGGVSDEFYARYGAPEIFMSTDGVTEFDTATQDISTAYHICNAFYNTNNSLCSVGLGSDSTGGDVGTGTRTGFCLGARVAGSFQPINVCEFIVYPSILSSGNRMLVNDYLKTKYAISG